MRYFLDTEFDEDVNGHMDLISVGIVDEKGREYYAENYCANYPVISRDHDWIRKNVLDSMQGGFSKWGTQYTPEVPLDRDRAGSPWKSAYEIKTELLAFIGEDPEPMFWGYFCDYDWVLFCKLFGKMVDLPKGWPMFCLDLKQIMYLDSRILKQKPPIPQPEQQHHALVDARWNRDLWVALGCP